MNKINWKEKLSSRKLWVAIAGLISAIVLILCNDGEIAATVSSGVIALGSVVAYILSEGWVDVAEANARAAASLAAAAAANKNEEKKDA